VNAIFHNSSLLQTRLLWAAVAVLGAVAFGIVALNRGEAVNAAWLAVAAVCIHFIALPVLPSVRRQPGTRRRRCAANAAHSRPRQLGVAMQRGLARFAPVRVGLCKGVSLPAATERADEVRVGGVPGWTCKHHGARSRRRARSNCV
jgi:hypothetical protein